MPAFLPAFLPAAAQWLPSSVNRYSTFQFVAQLQVLPEALDDETMLNVTVSASCAGTAGTVVQQLAGDAVFNADKTHITMLMTTKDEATGVALSLGR
jgi:hypothetical protein